MTTRTQLGLTCGYCGSEPDMPCYERERSPLDAPCLLQEDVDLLVMHPNPEGDNVYPALAVAAFIIAVICLIILL